MATLNYTKADDLKLILSEQEQAQLSDDKTTGNIVIDGPVIGAYLSFSESIVDSYLTQRYDVPLEDPVAPSVKFAALVIAKYYLFLRRDYLSETVEAEYTSIIAWLDQVSTGMVDIPVEGEDTEGKMVYRGFGSKAELRFREVFL